MLDNPETSNSGDNVDGAENDRCHVTVGDTSRAEDGCAIVEEKVRTSELLSCLKSHSEKGAVQHARSGEDLIPRVVAACSLGCELLLDFRNFIIDQRREGVDAIETTHVIASFVNSAHTICVSRGFGHE